jgi:hypothetical protein
MNALGMYKLGSHSWLFLVDINTRLQMTPMMSTRPLPQLLPQRPLLPLHLSQTHMRSMLNLSKAILPRIHTASRATRATLQRIRMPNRVTLRLTLTASHRLCFLLMTRE